MNIKERIKARRVELCSASLEPTMEELILYYYTSHNMPDAEALTAKYIDLWIKEYEQ